VHLCFQLFESKTGLKMSVFDILIGLEKQIWTGVSEAAGSGSTECYGLFRSLLIHHQLW